MNTAPLLVVLPYYNGDFELAKKLSEWIVNLGTCKPHSMLLAADDTVPGDKARELMNILRPVFHETRTMLIPVPAKTPEAPRWIPNEMFLSAARQVKANYKLPFLWLEADCVPLCEGWLQKIAEAYAACPKRFMGPIVHQEGQMGLPADHLTGCSVYPNDAIDLIGPIDSIKKGSTAWDIGSAGTVVPKASNTNLIHHFWGNKDLPPVFVENRDVDDPPNFVTLDFIRKDAVMFHRSKDGNLIKILRKAMTPPVTLETLNAPFEKHESAPPLVPEIGEGETPTTPETPKTPAPAKKNK